MPVRSYLWAWLVLLAACETGTGVVQDSRAVLAGMDVEELQSCAGIPTRTKRLNERTELLSYEQKNENVGGLQVAIPLLGGFKLAGSGSYCHAIFRVVDGRVAELHFTGDNDDALGEEGVCAPIVRGCLRAHGPAAQPDDTASTEASSAAPQP